MYSVKLPKWPSTLHILTQKITLIAIILSGEVPAALKTMKPSSDNSKKTLKELW